MASSFSIILPSSVQSQTATENKTNRYRVHLPRTLYFSDGAWVCGMSNIIFTNSWPSIGTLDQQYVDIYLKNGRRARVEIPKGSYASPEVLETALKDIIKAAAAPAGARQRPKRDLENSSLLRNAQLAVDTEKAQFALGLLRRANQSKPADTEDTHYAWDGKSEFFATPRLKLPPGFRYVRQELWWEEDGARIWAYPYFDIENVADAGMLEIARKALETKTTERAPLPATHRYVKSPDGSYTIEQLPPSDNQMLRWAEVMLDVERKADFLWPPLKSKHPRIKKETFLEDEKKWRWDTEYVPRPPIPRTHRYVKRMRTTEDGEQLASIEIEVSPSPEEAFTETGISAVAHFSESHPGGDKEPPPEKTIYSERFLREGETLTSTPGGGAVAEITETDVQEEERGPPVLTSTLVTDHGDNSEESAPASSLVAVDDTMDLEPPTKQPRQSVAVARAKPHHEEKPPSADDMDLAEVIRGTHFAFLKGVDRFQLHTDKEKVRFVALSTQLNYALGYETDSKIAPFDIAPYQSDLKGGIAHICVYTKGLIEDVIVGDELSALLRVVAVDGTPGDIIERNYSSPMYSRVLPTSVSVIDVELRTLSGRLVPFQYGQVILTLHFKKSITF